MQSMDCIICDTIFRANFFFDLVWHFVNSTASTQLCLRAENVVFETLSKLRWQRNLRKYVTDSVKVLGYKHFLAKSTAVRPAWKAKFCAAYERVFTRK
jgi:hypothetical protein